MLNNGLHDKLYTAQKRCITLVAGHQDVEKAMKDLWILKLQDIIMLELCKFGYKITNKMLPVLIDRLMNAWGGKKQHHYPVRNKAMPNVQHDTNLFNKSFMCKSITSFNALHIDEKRATSMKSLVNRLKIRLLN